MQQGSYLLLEEGMAVQGRDGYLGTITEVVADEMADIFRGFMMSAEARPGEDVFVPADLVLNVLGHTAEVDLVRAEMARLESRRGILVRA